MLAAVQPAEPAEPAQPASLVEKRAVFLRARRDAFDAEWKDCWGQRAEGESFRACVRRVAIAAARFLEDNTNFYRGVIAAREYAPGDQRNHPPLDMARNLKNFNEMYQTYLKYRDAQCFFEAARVRTANPDVSYLRVARCHFRTAFEMSFVVAQVLNL
ncbi:hypothetical protein [Methylobacterium mesophilicum]